MFKKWDTAIFRYKVYRNDREGNSLEVMLHAKESTQCRKQAINKYLYGLIFSLRVERNPCKAIVSASQSSCEIRRSKSL